MSTYISSTRLTGKISGQIISSGKIPGLGKKGTVWYEHGQLADGRWQYGLAPGTVPVLPTPAANVGALTFTTAAGGIEGCLLTDFVAIGVGRLGSIGTAGNVPTGVPTDVASGLYRVGLHFHATTPLMSDAVLLGRSVEGFVVAHRVGGKAVRSASALLTGYTQVTGEVTAEPAAIRWQGSTNGKVQIDQRISIDGKRIVIDVDLINRTGADLADLRYMRLIDFDQAEAFDTASEVIERGRARATLAGGRVLTVGSDDLRASIGLAAAVPPVVDPYAIAALPVGTRRKGDHAIHVAFDLGTLKVGASTSLQIVIDGSAIAS